MRSEDGFAVGGAGEPGETGADTVGPAVSTESVPCVELSGRRWRGKRSHSFEMPSEENRGVTRWEAMQH